MLRLHDTALGRVEALQPREDGKVSMYVCGPTVYDNPHIGHGRFSVVFDVLRRYLQWRGFDVTYVSNITDIDDNIINRAATEGRDWTAVVSEYEAAWWDAMDRLGVQRPDESPHATGYVDQMIELVSDLVGRGVAYQTSDGVYLEVDKVPGYGLLARQSLESLRAGARVAVAEEKRSPVDFALWKTAKPGEPSWESPWGPGRPGWHTECVVMSLDLLGEGFDLHGGGMDLAFPHHENERAQAVALDRRFARRWVHNAFVVDAKGEKMSKSLGNFTSLTELLGEHDGRAYRLLLLQAHYRSPVEVTRDAMDRAARSLATLDAFARRAAALPAQPPDRETVDQFTARMDDDLDTPAAMALLFELVHRGHTALDRGDEKDGAVAWATACLLAGVVGLELRGEGLEEIDAATAALIAARDEARAGRDFGRADAIRDELTAQGWVVEDTPAGTRVHRSS